MQIRLIDRDPEDGRISLGDYDLLAAWWRARGAEPPHRSVLPTLGVVTLSDGQPCAMAFAYLDATGSGMAQIGWMTTDPALPARRSLRALDVALDFLESELGRLGYWAAHGFFAAPALSRHLARRGYAPMESGLTYVLKPVATHGNRS